MRDGGLLFDHCGSRAMGHAGMGLFQPAAARPVDAPKAFPNRQFPFGRENPSEPAHSPHAKPARAVWRDRSDRTYLFPPSFATKRRICRCPCGGAPRPHLGHILPKDQALPLGPFAKSLRGRIRARTMALDHHRVEPFKFGRPERQGLVLSSAGMRLAKGVGGGPAGEILLRRP